MSDSLIHAVAGSTGGVIAMTLTYPLIFLSTRAAVETKKEQKTTRQAVIDTLKSEGILGLYSGLGSSLLGIAVTNGVYYFFFEKTRAVLLASRKLNDSDFRGLTTLESMFAGFLAGMSSRVPVTKRVPTPLAGSVTTIASNPIWVVQTTQATQSMSESEGTVTAKRGIVGTIRSIIRAGGVQALWRGVGPALILVINPILQYTCFEQLRNLIIRRRLSKARSATLSDLDVLVMSAIAKLVATSITYPYIVLKSRAQAARASADAPSSIAASLMAILSAEGPAGFYKGLGNKLIQSVLTASFLFVSQRRLYEAAKTAMGLRPHSRH
ncbi:hypothetical protein BOTBODRAFT_172397 [Botryobasidium botryosum FD-172 SS1]|uniref:Mitochondrial carrier n=1 Tax=Botryobasidium botryosum (strain FD-172 SS1) TaxID=930990 RepID=A0A067MP99_BOTB1|nr:hypothetical protein BOTBODRAFT_172397 [Botryobasidium botryosum FD-172 SS1]